MADLVRLPWVQTVRNAICAFDSQGLAALSAGSPRPKSAAPLLDQAKLTVDRAKRAQMFADADKRITELAPNVPWVWDKQPNIASKNVAAVGSSYNATIDLNFTSIKK